MPSQEPPDAVPPSSNEPEFAPPSPSESQPSDNSELEEHFGPPPADSFAASAGESSAAEDAPPPPPQPPLALRFARGLVAGNYLYIASALLVMSGCKLLMTAPGATDEEIVRTLRSLAILQGYEVLLLVTIFAIVRKLRIASDAFTLLGIELLLVFDITFFSNSFHTIYITTDYFMPSLGVNLIVFGLIVPKLAFLFHTFGLRIRPRVWFGLLVAGFFVHLAEFPMNLEAEGVNLATYFFALAWTPLAVAFAMGPVRRLARIVPPGGGIMTRQQARRLPRLLFALPLLAVTAHFLESIEVYWIDLRPMYIAPLLLAAMALVPLQVRRREASRGQWLALSDWLAATAFVLSLPGLNRHSIKSVYVGVEAVTPSAELAALALPVVAAATATLYIYYWIRLRDARALIRAGALVGAGTLVALYRAGALGAAWASISTIAKGSLATTVATWATLTQLYDNAATAIAAAWLPLTLVVWIAALAFAWLRPHIVTWTFAGGWSIYAIFSLLPGGPSVFVPEIFQAVCFLAALLFHRFGGRADIALGAAALGCLAGLAAYIAADQPWGVWVVVGEASAMAAVGVLARRPGYGAVAALSALILLARDGRWFLRDVPLPVGLLAAGLVCFAAAVALTFSRQYLLDWLRRLESAERPVRENV